MRSTRHGRLINRRGFLDCATLAGAAALAPQVVQVQAAGSEPLVRLAQAGANAASPVSAITVKSAEHLVGSAVSYAYAVKAGPFIFLNGHEAYDFEKGLASEVEGPPGYPLSGRPPLRREADYILRRMRTILKDFGTDLPQTVRVDQYYTKGPAVSAYHLARFAEFGGYIAPEHLDHHGSLFHRAHQHARVPAGGHARAGVGHSEDHAPRSADFGLRLQPRGGRQ